VKSRIVIFAMLLVAVILLLSDGGIAADHTVLYPDLVQYYYWTRGCAPTATAMVLSYRDCVASTVGKYINWGKLIDYYYSPDGINSVPNLLNELAVAMGTTEGGGTSLNDVDRGIETVTNTINEYSFDAATFNYGVCATDCWNRIVSEISNNRPFVWHLLGPSDGHSTAAWGYTDDHFVILYDTWDSAPLFPYTTLREDWHYRASILGWDQRALTSIRHLSVPEATDVQIGEPYGGERILSGRNYNIWWSQWGNVTHVSLYYSTNNGYTWTAIALRVPSTGEGRRSYRWLAPCVSSSRMRIRLRAYKNTELIAGDGSLHAFTIVPSEVVAPSNVACDKTRVKVGETYTISWDPVRYATSYDIYENGAWTSVGDVTSVSFTKTRVGSHTYMVRAKNTCFMSEQSRPLFVNVYDIVAVWPGDLNNDGAVNQKDIMPIAVFWNTKGARHDGADYSWAPRSVESWDNYAATFADADGSGLVDMGDFLPICVNWGRTHSGSLTAPETIGEYDQKADESILVLMYSQVKYAQSGAKYEIKNFIEEKLSIHPPAASVLQQNVPNPFNPSTSIRYDVMGRERVCINIFNVQGLRIRTLVDAIHEPGSYAAEWNGTDNAGRSVASGIYYYRMRAGQYTGTKKMVLVR